MTGKKRKYSNVRIVLAHLGGSAPFLASRVAILSGHMGCSLSPEKIVDGFKTFYYETALSACETTLSAMENFVGRDKLLLGTDFPGMRATSVLNLFFQFMVHGFAAVSKDMASWFTDQLDKHYIKDPQTLQHINQYNAARLFPRLLDNSIGSKTNVLSDPRPGR